MSICEEFAKLGIDISKIVWTNVFHHTQARMSDGIVVDDDQQYREESVNGGGFRSRSLCIDVVTPFDIPGFVIQVGG